MGRAIICILIPFTVADTSAQSTNTPLGLLIMMAYDVTLHQVSLIDSALYEKYDIRAIADHPVGRHQMLRMLQALLADRFKLSLRREGPK